MAKQSTLEDLRRTQLEFAAHMRDPANTPAPADIETRRMDIYRRLFINNVTNFLKSTYRRTYQLLGDTRWKALVRDYYRDHISEAALFPELPKAFLKYLTDERPTGMHTDDQPDPPWLTELAHYEWVECGLRFAADPEPNDKLQQDADLLESRPIVSELAWLLSYRYPVDKISADFLPDEPSEQPHYYLAYRNAEFQVKYVGVNPVSARLFELARDFPEQTGRAHLAVIATELKHPDPGAVMASGLSILQQWQDKQILVGSLPTPD
jgi:hypothetical protein